MLMITRTDSTIELARNGGNGVAVDVVGVASAMLCVERAPCGRVGQVLALVPADGTAPLRIEGSKAELSALHEAISEMMAEMSYPRAVH